VGESVTLRCFVTAGRKASSITGFDTWREAWAVDVAAPAERDRANRELLRYLAEMLGIPAERVRLAGGVRSRLKAVRVDGLDAAAVERRLRAAASSQS